MKSWKIVTQNKPLYSNLMAYIVFADGRYQVPCYIDAPAGFPQALEIMENLENHLKSSMHGKIMEFEKNLNNHDKIIEFCKII